MAKIKNIREQQKALEKVESLINEIKKSIDFLKNRPDDNMYKISYFVPNDDYGFVCETNLELIGNDMGYIECYINRYVSKLKDKVKDMCCTYGIELNDSEKQYVESK